MSIAKQAKDYAVKIASGGRSADKQLFEFHEYFKLYGAIRFEFITEDGFIVAKSTNFRHGSIITFGKDQKELDKKIKDAILTMFEIPSVYADKAKVTNGVEKEAYACA